MAPRATDRLGQESAPHDLQLLIDHVHPQLVFVLVFKVRITERQHGGRRHLPAAFLPGIGGQQIAGHLFDHESVER